MVRRWSSREYIRLRRGLLYHRALHLGQAKEEIAEVKGGGDFDRLQEPFELQIQVADVDGEPVTVVMRRVRLENNRENGLYTWSEPGRLILDVEDLAAVGTEANVGTGWGGRGIAIEGVMGTVRRVYASMTKLRRPAA